MNSQDYTVIASNDLINSEITGSIQVKSSESCVETIILDYNDPALKIEMAEFLVPLMVWPQIILDGEVFVNGEEGNLPNSKSIDQTSTCTSLPIGQYLDYGVQDLEIRCTDLV